MAASSLARGLQAPLHDGCKPLGRVLPPVVVGANDYSPLREGYMIEVLRHPQSLRCDTHKACVASLAKPALSVSHWGGCLPRGGEGVSPEAGRVSSPRQEECLPRGGTSVFLGAGRVSSPRQEGCLPRGRKGVFPEAGRVSPPRRGGCLPRGRKSVFLEAGRVSSPVRLFRSHRLIIDNYPFTINPPPSSALPREQDPSVW